MDTSVGQISQIPVFAALTSSELESQRVFDLVFRVFVFRLLDYDVIQLITGDVGDVAQRKTFNYLSTSTLPYRSHIRFRILYVLE